VRHRAYLPVSCSPTLCVYAEAYHIGAPLMDLKQPGPAITMIIAPTRHSRFCYGLGHHGYGVQVRKPRGQSGLTLFHVSARCSKPAG